MRRLRREWSSLVSALASHCRCERFRGRVRRGCFLGAKKKKNAPRPRHCQRSSLQGPGSALVRKRKPKLNGAFFLCSFFSSFPLYPATLSMSPPHITFLVSTQCRFFFSCISCVLADRLNWTSSLCLFAVIIIHRTSIILLSYFSFSRAS